MLEKQGTDEANDGRVVLEDANDMGPALDLRIQTFQRIGGMNLGAVSLGTLHEGEHVGLRLVH